jgi:hypothetical protein
MNFTQALPYVLIILALGVVLVCVVAVSRGSNGDETIARLLAELTRREAKPTLKHDRQKSRRKRKPRRKALTI